MPPPPSETTSDAARRPSGEPRLRFVDAARGTAMLFVLVSHFGYTFFTNQQDPAPRLMRLVGMVASPTFAVISGLLIGFLYRTQGAGFERVRARLMDRGLFLLTVGHFLIFWSHPPRLAVSLFLTDTIGVAMIVGPWLVARIPAQRRLPVALAAYSVAWAAVALWHPPAGAAHLVRETLFGATEGAVYGYAFPLVPWLSLDFASSALGDSLGGAFLRGDAGAIERLLGRSAVGTMAAAVALAAVHLTVKSVAGVVNPALALVTSPFQKQPPSLEYFLFYGSIGLGFVFLWRVLEHRGRLGRIRALAMAVGQASLVVFIIQWYVYFPILQTVRSHLPSRLAWPIYFIASVLVIVLPALAWRARGLDRYITVGYRARWERGPGRAERQGAGLAPAG